MIGRSSDVIVPRGHRAEFGRLLARVKRGEVVQHFETMRLRKDGKVIYISLTLSPVRGANGQLIP